MILKTLYHPKRPGLPAEVCEAIPEDPRDGYVLPGGEHVKTSQLAAAKARKMFLAAGWKVKENNQ